PTLASTAPRAIRIASVSGSSGEPGSGSGAACCLAACSYIGPDADMSTCGSLRACPKDQAGAQSMANGAIWARPAARASQADNGKGGGRSGGMDTDGTKPNNTALEAPVTAVTVFRHAAQVTRTAAADLTPGLQPVVIGSLPPSVDRASVRVAVRGAHVALLEV